jgi:hypothetical protein
MGLGCARSEWDDFEWFALHAEVGAADKIWVDDGSVRVLLCDLDNLRADPRRLRSRMQVAVELARQADVTAFAGQADSVGRCRGLLAEFADDVVTAGPDRDAADEALLACADHVRDRHVQFAVMSNDGIFARLAVRGALTIVSPSQLKVSSRLVNAARAVVDVSDLATDEIVPAVA